MKIKDLKEHLRDIPDDMEIIIELGRNQHDVFRVGEAKENEDGLYEFIDDDSISSEDNLNFLISG